jgi:phospholipid/cholesterol/gamma-HCH transport system substrate-binding protein
MRRLVALTVAVALVLTACSLLGGSQPRTYKAMFSRAVQLFPAGKVRVLGVDVGSIKDVRNSGQGVEVTFIVEEPGVRLPANVEAAIVPASLLGERYVQLFPAYQGGPTLRPDATIPMERTAVPSEPDELLRSLQDYLGAIDPEAVDAFVTNVSAVLEGNGQELNTLIHNAANVIGTLASKRDDLAKIIVEFERLTSALATRKAALERLIHSYNAVVGTITSNRAAVEGTITGLNQMTVELASFLVAHRGELDQDLDILTTTGRTLRRNVDTFARTGHWASRLFRAARVAVDFDKDWLRLNGQEQNLPLLIIEDLQIQLMEVCEEFGLPFCASPAYWRTNVPSLFCLQDSCPGPKPAEEPVQEQLAEAIEQVPQLADSLLEQFQEISCANAKDKAACIKRKQILVDCARAPQPKQCVKDHAVEISCLKADNVRACIERKRDQDVRDIADGILDDTLGSPEDFGVGVP